MSFLVASGGQQPTSRAMSPASTSCSSEIPAGSRASMPMARRPRPRGARSLDRVIAEKGMIAGYRFGFPNVGTLSKDGNGYAFAAVKA